MSRLHSFLQSVLLAGTCSLTFGADPTAPAPIPETAASVPSVPPAPQPDTNAPPSLAEEPAEATPAGNEATTPAGAAPAQRPPADARRGDRPSREDPRSLDRFRLIVDRNIFDSERRKQIADREPPPRTERPSTRTISLNGTISYGGKAFAFVSSSEPEYRGVFSPGDTLGNWRLASVDTRGVKLEANDVVIDLPVGKSLRREDEEAWTISDEFMGSVTSGRFASSSTERPVPGGPRQSDATGGQPPATGGPATSSASGDMSDILKRMMERRQQEQSQ